jgi:hypothetical protein
MSDYYDKLAAKADQVSWGRLIVLMAASFLGLASASSVYLGGFLFGLGIQFSPFVDSGALYESLQEVVFFFSVLFVYLRLMEVQFRAMMKNGRRRETARRRYREMKGLPPAISRSARFFLRVFLAPLAGLFLLTGMLAILMSKFLSPTQTIIWIFGNILASFFFFWLIARFATRSSKNIKAIKMLWSSLIVDGRLSLHLLLQKRGALSVLAIAVLFAALTLGTARFQSLATSAPVCIQTNYGKVFGSIIIQTRSGLIISRSPSQSSSLRIGSHDLMYLDSSNIQAVSLNCPLSV